MSRPGSADGFLCFCWFAGQYWQVADGPCSSLTISTDDIPLGSYTMDIVIYHYRSKEKFIPLGYASTQFSITGKFGAEQKVTNRRVKLHTGLIKGLFTLVIDMNLVFILSC